MCKLGDKALKKHLQEMEIDMAKEETQVAQPSHPLSYLSVEKEPSKPDLSCQRVAQPSNPCDLSVEKEPAKPDLSCQSLAQPSHSPYLSVVKDPAKPDLSC